MPLQLATEIEEICKASMDVRAARLANAFRRVCKDMTWNTREYLHPKLLPCPTVNVSPVMATIDGQMHFTLTSLLNDQALRVTCDPHSFEVADVTGNCKTMSYDPTHSDVAARFEKKITNWINKNAPGKPRTAFDALNP